MPGTPWWAFRRGLLEIFLNYKTLILFSIVSYYNIWYFWVRHVVPTYNSNTLGSETGGLTSSLRSSGTVRATCETLFQEAKTNKPKLHNNNRALCVFGYLPLPWWAGLDRVVLRMAVWPWWWQKRTFGSGFQKIGSMVFRKSSLVISTKFCFGLLRVNEWGAGRILYPLPWEQSQYFCKP